MSGGFRPRMPNDSALFRARPSEDPAYVAFAGTQSFMCFILTAALAQMSRWADAAGAREIIGRLGGRYCRDVHGPYVLVERAVLCDSADGSAGSVRADEEAQHQLRRDFERACRPLDSVGWFHSHAKDIGLFFSSTDRANQRTWDHPNSVGIVLHAGLAGDGLRVYRGPDTEETTLCSPEVLDAVRRGQAASELGSETPAGHVSWHPVKRPTVRFRWEVVAVAVVLVAIWALVVALQSRGTPATDSQPPNTPTSAPVVAPAGDHPPSPRDGNVSKQLPNRHPAGLSRQSDSRN